MCLAAYMLMSWFKESMKPLTLWQKHCSSVRWCHRTASSYHKRMLYFSGTMNDTLYKIRPNSACKRKHSRQ
jgi:hypothetical protein